MALIMTNETSDCMILSSWCTRSQVLPVYWMPIVRCLQRRCSVYIDAKQEGERLRFIELTSVPKELRSLRWKPGIRRVGCIFDEFF